MKVGDKLILDDKEIRVVFIFKTRIGVMFHALDKFNKSYRNLKEKDFKNGINIR